MSAQTPSTGLPGLRKLTPKEQAQRAAAFACLSSGGQPSCSKVIWAGIFFDGGNFMKLNRTFKMVFQLLLILSLSGLAACSEKEESKQDHMAAGAVAGVNYTGEGIQSFYVDGAAGPNVGRYGGGGGVCCAMYPRVWTPDLKVTVKWERTDGREPDGKRWKLKKVEKTVPIEKYSEVGEVYVAFLPNDDIRVYISTVGPRNKDFPSKLGYPKDPDETKSTKP